VNDGAHGEAERLRALLRHVSETVTVLDATGKVLWASGNPQGTLGHSDEYWIGRSPIEIVHPEDVPMVLSLMERLLDEPDLEVRGEFRAQSADGTWHHIEGLGFNRLADPLIGGIVLTTRNVTQRKRTELLLAGQARVLEGIATGHALGVTLDEIDRLVAEHGDRVPADHLRSIAREAAGHADRMVRLALHDSLTSLPNRTLLLDRLESALRRMGRHRRSVAVLFLDLDRFKVVNDSLGHGAGDELLRTLAARLQATVRPGDTVARFGGDEFVVVCEEVTDIDHARAVARRVTAVLDEPFVVQGSQLVVTASVGIAVAATADDAAEALLRDADAAMYRAKERGRGRVEVFDAAMRARALSRLRVEGELREGLHRDELQVHYQPVVSVVDRRLVGVEAVVRWAHPSGDLLLPVDFLDIAEDTGLVVAMEEIVLGIALADAAACWDRDTLDVAVNASTVHLTDPGFVTTVRRALDAAGWPAERLVIELSERALLTDDATIHATLAGLRRLGVRSVVDDFGTGYSSLGYLHRFPVDGVKIDRSFVERLGTGDRQEAVVAAILGMAQALGLQVVAEGVETEAQLAALRRLGCDRAQGYLLGRPAPAESFGRGRGRGVDGPGGDGG
jgi:diguanylate cyclase (GGDEF)-like protein/PAS domain S-box-containing protein